MVNTFYPMQKINTYDTTTLCIVYIGVGINLWLFCYDFHMLSGWFHPLREGYCNVMLLLHMCTPYEVWYIRED